MPIHDFRKLDRDAHLQADLCIVGSGPAAWTICDELRDSGLSVLVLESGAARESDGSADDLEAAALNETVDVGQPLFNGRRRRLGGTTEVGGWANRTTPFDPIDYEARPWVDHSGWPIGAATIAPYLARASAQLGAGTAPPATPLLPRGKSWPAFDTGQIAPVTWVFGQSDEGRVMRYALQFRRTHQPHVRLLVHATVTQILTNGPGTLVEGVEIRSTDGRCATVSARAVVLAAGGIENPRLLLCSNRIVAAGLGNGHGLVGRFLMDHPRDLDMAVTFDLADAGRLRAMFGPFRIDRGQGRRFVANGFALSPERQRRDRLLNCAAWPIEETAVDDPIGAARRLARRQGAIGDDARTILRNAGHLVGSARRRLLSDHALHSKPARIGLIIGSEQQPDPDSRVTLADAVDAFGLPLACTNWRINALERASQIVLAQAVKREFARLGLPRPTLAEWAEDGAKTQARLVDGCHPTGTTRMADDPRHGVVDADCQVHGVSGLYVAGSSVFPTAGHANPTLMIAAMAARLADHLAATLTARPAQEGLQAPASEASGEAYPALTDAPDTSWSGLSVAVTGASGFLGGRLVERLLAEGARVTSLQRRAPTGAMHPGMQAQVLDLADADAVRAATAEADYVFHCAYDWNDEGWNRRALAALIAAGRAHRWKRLVHVSSFVVYDLPPGGTFDETAIDTTERRGYARTKLDLEAMLAAAAQDTGLSATILQPTLIYGPGSQPWTIDPADKLANGTVILPDDGAGICNAVFVDDVVNAMLLAARAPEATGQRMLVSGEPVTWRQFYETLARTAGVPGPECVPRETIVAQNRALARAMRGVLTPRLLARKLAGVGPVRRVMTGLAAKLPERAARSLQDQLYGPITRLRGHRHLPDAGGLRFLEATARIDSARAHALIGYAPRFDLETGMAATARFLRHRS